MKQNASVLPVFIALVFALAAESVTATELQEPSSFKPNIVIIYADDLGYGDVGCYGATMIKTPNIDKLATQGMKFTDAHAAGSLCSPSRLSLIHISEPTRPY